MTELRDLLENLRQGERPALGLEDVELLLSWLTGSAARDDAHDADLPRPGHDPVLLQMVFHRLDDVLFSGDELKLNAAGLDLEEPITRRRIRFRRLASAFHPDRFPELADWLTERSQAVHRAYAHFKANPEAPAPVAPPYPPARSASPGARNMRRRRPSRPKKKALRIWANSLRERFGHDRYLAHKLIGGLAVIALLPVLNLLLAPGKDTLDSDTGGEATVDGLRFTVDAEKPAAKTRSQPCGSGIRPRLVGADGASDRRIRHRGRTVAVGYRSHSGLWHRLQKLQVQVAVSGRDRSAPETPPTAEPDAKAGESDLATIAENGKRKTESANPTGSLAGQAPTAVEDVEPNSASEDPDVATVAENGKPKTENDAVSDPEVTPLLAAARRAMNPNGHPTPVATLPSVDEQLAAMGLESDTERLYRRMGSGEKAPVDGERLTVDGEKPAAKTDVAGATCRRSQADRRIRQSGHERFRFSVFRFPTGEARAAAEGGGAGAVSGRDQSAPETPL